MTLWECRRFFWVWWMHMNYVWFSILPGPMIKQPTKCFLRILNQYWQSLSANKTVPKYEPPAASLVSSTATIKASSTIVNQKIPVHIGSGNCQGAGFHKTELLLLLFSVNLAPICEGFYVGMSRGPLGSRCQVHHPYSKASSSLTSRAGGDGLADVFVEQNFIPSIIV